jgi:hypothetical protein
MAADHQRIERNFLGYLHKKETQEHSIKDLSSTIREVAHKTTTVVMTEAHIHSSLCAACIMAVR